MPLLSKIHLLLEYRKIGCGDESVSRRCLELSFHLRKLFINFPGGGQNSRPTIEPAFKDVLSKY
jgi:hypothetical protein